MARWAPARADVIREYAQEVLGLFPSGRILVGVGGIDRPVREGFATDLASALRDGGTASAALSLDDFPGDPSGTGPDALVREAYDVAVFRRLVVDPYRRGDAVVTQASADADADATGFRPAQRAVLVVSGAFVHRADLAGLWHASAWLQVPRPAAREREAARLGVGADDPVVTARSAAVDRFFQHVDPRKLAGASFDLADAEHPRRVFADAC